MMQNKCPVGARGYRRPSLADAWDWFRRVVLVLVQLPGRNRRRATITGTSPRASVSDTNVWQLAFLPSAEAYCEATPTNSMNQGDAPSHPSSARQTEERHELARLVEAAHVSDLGGDGHGDWEGPLRMVC